MRTPSRIIPVVLLLFACAGCAGEDGAASAATAIGRGGRGGACGPGVPVAVGTVIQKAMPIEISVIGAAEAVTAVTMTSDTSAVSGRISSPQSAGAMVPHVTCRKPQRPQRGSPMNSPRIARPV